MTRQLQQKKRAVKTKAIIRKSNRPRLVVYRSLTHVYAQIVIRSEKGDQVIASSSSVDQELKKNLTGNKSEQAYQVGQLLALRAKENKIVEVAFDRNGYKYHGRIKSLADGAREAGLNF